MKVGARTSSIVSPPFAFARIAVPSTVLFSATPDALALCSRRIEGETRKASQDALSGQKSFDSISTPTTSMASAAHSVVDQHVSDRLGVGILRKSSASAFLVANIHR
ncbi:hypothetical protein ACFIOY_19415 [Bradyrhizobium sp. TZ2]